MTQAKTERNALIRELRDKKYSLRRISKIVNISHERVRQILAAGDK